MENVTQQENKREAKRYSPLALAFLGDAVYELCARRSLLTQGQCPVDKLNRRKVEMVNASAQSEAFQKIEALLTPEELAIFKRGRNGHSCGVPKNATVAEYRRATGVEALFGYLFLEQQYARIEQLFSMMTEDIEDEGQAC